MQFLKLKYFTCLLILASLIFIGCKDKSGENGSGKSSNDTENTSDKDTSTDDSNSGTNIDSIDTTAKPDTNPPIDVVPRDTENMEICAELTNELSKVQTRVMILLDRSGSMRNANKWEQSIEAIEFMVNNYDEDLAFGLDLFPVGNLQRSCNVGTLAALDIASNNAEEVNSLLGNTDIGSSTPLYLAIANYLNPEYAPIFSNNEGNSYLVVVSDGADSCGLDGIFNTSATNDELSQITAQLLEERGIKTIVIGFGDEADPAQLNAMAAMGGSMFTEYIDAADGEILASSLLDIAQTVTTNCDFVVGEFDEEENVNIDFVNVYFGNEIIPRDDDCEAQTGWTWLNDEKTTIGFCEESCATLEAGFVEEINVKVACTIDDVIIVIK